MSAQIYSFIPSLWSIRASSDPRVTDAPMWSGRSLVEAAKEAHFNHSRAIARRAQTFIAENLPPIKRRRKN